MNILPINRTVSFLGREVISKNLTYDNIRKMQGYYPNSTIETTIGWNHKIRKDKVYFAEPMEPISEDLKRNVDYVVYDNEPKYPDIEDVRKNYLEQNRTNYREKFEEIREYFYRREMGGFANTEEAKNGQRIAAECTGFYDRAGDLRYKKEMAEDEVRELSAKQERIQEGINSTVNELRAQQELKKTIDSHIENLEKLQKPYDDISKLVESSGSNENNMYNTAEERIEGIKSQREYLEQLQNTAYYYEGESAVHEDIIPKFDKYVNTSATYDAIHSLRYSSNLVNKDVVKKQINMLQETISTFKLIQRSCESTIKEMEAYIANLRVQSAKTDGLILYRNSYIRDCKSQLEKHFAELKNFYISNVIKLAKK